MSHPALIDTLFQGMNSVVKHGYDSWWRPPHPLPTGLPGPALQAGARGGAHPPQPAWLDTRSTWSTIATRRYDEQQNKVATANSQSFGFYGYERVYPSDFFKVMKDTLGRQ